MPAVTPQQIAAWARQRGLDSRAVLAVAAQEGLGGGIGDGGHAFGPFQVNDAGGVLTGRFPSWSPEQKNAWAWSPEGVNFALAGIQRVARGLRGPSAVEAIVRRYERPAAPDAEVSRALAGYGGQVSSSSGASVSSSSPSKSVSSPPRRPPFSSSAPAGGSSDDQRRAFALALLSAMGSNGSLSGSGLVAALQARRAA